MESIVEAQKTDYERQLKRLKAKIVALKDRIAKYKVRFENESEKKIKEMIKASEEKLQVKVKSLENKLSL